jgi:hypothetical protein
VGKKASQSVAGAVYNVRNERVRWPIEVSEKGHLQRKNTGRHVVCCDVTHGLVVQYDDACKMEAVEVGKRNDAIMHIHDTRPHIHRG